MTRLFETHRARTPVASGVRVLAVAGLLGGLVGCDAGPAELEGGGSPAADVNPVRELESSQPWTLPPVPAGLGASLAQDLERRRRVVLTNLEHAGTIGELGIFYEANGMRAEAIALLRRARELDPGDPHWASHEAWILAQEGRLEEALALLELTLEQHPDFAPLWSQTGSVARQLGRLEWAEEAYRELVRRAPRRSEGHLGLAETWLAAGRAEQALVELELALELEPGYRRLHYVLGLAYRDLGRLDDAQRELTLGAQARVRRSWDRWSEALMTWSHDRSVRLTVAMQLQARGRANEALEHLQETLAMEPDDPRTLAQIGLAQRALGDLDAAIESLRAAVAIAPESYQARINLGQMLLEMGLVDEAIAEAAAAIQAGPGVAKAHMLSADALFTAGREEPAIAALEAALERAPSDAQMHAHAARRLLAQGQTELAVQHLDAVLRSHPHDPELLELLASARNESNRAATPNR